jgi:sigma54-dependent transcription regulator
MIERLDLVAGTTDAPIFLLGESATGKSALAARLHELKLVRRRMKGLLVQVNCATLRDGALPALLGQRRAAMGAAGSKRPGYLHEADVLADPAALDAFDRVQLAAVIRTCRQTSSLSAAGRALFAASRRESQPERCRPVAQIPCPLRA